MHMYLPIKKIPQFRSQFCSVLRFSYDFLFFVFCKVNIEPDPSIRFPALYLFNFGSTAHHLKCLCRHSNEGWDCMTVHDTICYPQLYIQEPSGNHGFPAKSGPFLSLFLHIYNVKNFNIYGLNFLIRIYKNENLWTWSHLKYHDTVTYQRKINRGRSYLQHH